MPQKPDPDIIFQLGRLVEANDSHKEAIDTLSQQQKDTLKDVLETHQKFVAINMAEHKEFRESIEDLKGWRRWLIGVSVGVSAVVSIIAVIFGFVAKEGAWPLAAMPSEAEAAKKIEVYYPSTAERHEFLDPITIKAEENDENAYTSK